MPTPFPQQITGAKFLSDRTVALLADEPRVGKTGAAILAADDILADKILVVTTASGRPVWRRAWAEWSAYKRRPGNVQVVGWPEITEPMTRARLLADRFDLLVLDEAHYAKNFETKRTQAALGLAFQEADGGVLNVRQALTNHSARTWALTGTPFPNSLLDIYPLLRALTPERLYANSARGWPDVTRQSAFEDRYCKTRPKKVGAWKWIKIVMGGKNEAELRARLDGFMLLRTQQDVGINRPIYEIMPLTVSAAERRRADGDLDVQSILAAIDGGTTSDLDMHLGPLRRLSGEINARAVVEALHEEFDCGLDKIVLGYWHRDVGDILADGLRKYGVVRLDGSTSQTARARCEQDFSKPANRVFLGQIQAAGEAIDLSAAATLWFVETSLVPKDMLQFSLRITNFTQTRQALVRVCVIEGSIGEALQAVLLRKWAPIQEVLAA